MIIKQNEFCEFIEKQRIFTKTTYLDSILEACDRFSLDIEQVKPLLNEQILFRLEAEARKSNNLKAQKNISLEAHFPQAAR